VHALKQFICHVRSTTDSRGDLDTRPPNLPASYACLCANSSGLRMTLLQKKSLASVLSSAPRVSQKVIHPTDKKECISLRILPSSMPPLCPAYTLTPQPTESIESARKTRVQNPESRVQKILNSVIEVIDQPTTNTQSYDCKRET